MRELAWPLTIAALSVAFLLFVVFDRGPGRR